MDESTRMWVSLILGGFVLGYLLAEWYFDGLLRRLRDSNAALSSDLELAVAANDEAASKIRQYEAIFGEDALDSYAAMAEKLTAYEALLGLTVE